MHIFMYELQASHSSSWASLCIVIYDCRKNFKHIPFLKHKCLLAWATEVLSHVYQRIKHKTRSSNSWYFLILANSDYLISFRLVQKMKSTFHHRLQCRRDARYYKYRMIIADTCQIYRHTLLVLPFSKKIRDPPRTYLSKFIVSFENAKNCPRSKACFEDISSTFYRTSSLTVTNDGIFTLCGKGTLRTHLQHSLFRLYNELSVVTIRRMQY